MRKRRKTDHTKATFIYSCKGINAKLPAYVGGGGRGQNDLNNTMSSKSLSAAVKANIYFFP